MKGDKEYPYGREMKIDKEDGRFVRFGSTYYNAKLLFSLDKKVSISCYSSERYEINNIPCINYIIAVQDIEGQKWNLFEYRLRWGLDRDGDF